VCHAHRLVLVCLKALLHKGRGCQDWVGAASWTTPASPCSPGVGGSYILQ
jgi:hypothetical protein